MDSANAASAASRSKANSLAQRVGSVLFLLPGIILIIYWGTWPVVLLVTVAVMIGLREFFAVLRYGGYQPRAVTGYALGLMICAAVALIPFTPIDPVLPAMALVVVASLVAEVANPDRTNSLPNWAFTLAVALYLSTLLSVYITMRRLDTPLEQGWLAPLAIEPGAAWVYTTLAATWLQDTGAFFIGRQFGRTPMAPYLSPKKSWEGACGGFVVALITAMACVPLFGLPIALWKAALIGAAAGVFGPLGDLAESLFKRQIGVKDAGSLIPGHGGLLDRVDSMLFTAPVIYLLILLTVNF
jgi:phosphatidate cytidylyltransferase